MGNDLRPSCLYAGIMLVRTMKMQVCSADDARSYLLQGTAQNSTYDYDAAFSVAERHGWTIFDGCNENEGAFRETLKTWLRLERPIWRAIIPYGRGVTMQRLGPNAQACLQIAGLDRDTSEVRDWWDEAATEARSERDKCLLEAGRRAEQWSFRREERLLKGLALDPKWRSIEDNLAGFDIQTFRDAKSGGSCVPKDELDAQEWYIEVKYAGSGVVFLSRNEWRYAEEHPNTWELQVWFPNGEEPSQFSRDEVSIHIPQDNGEGEWQQVRISTSAWGDYQ